MEDHSLYTIWGYGIYLAMQCRPDHLGGKHATQEREDIPR